VKRKIGRVLQRPGRVCMPPKPHGTNILKFCRPSNCLHQRAFTSDAAGRKTSAPCRFLALAGFWRGFAVVGSPQFSRDPAYPIHWSPDWQIRPPANGSRNSMFSNHCNLRTQKFRNTLKQKISQFCTVEADRQPPHTLLVENAKNRPNRLSESQLGPFAVERLFFKNLRPPPRDRLRSRDRARTCISVSSLDPGGYNFLKLIQYFPSRCQRGVCDPLQRCGHSYKSSQFPVPVLGNPELFRTFSCC